MSLLQEPTFHHLRAYLRWKLIALPLEVRMLRQNFDMALLKFRMRLFKLRIFRLELSHCVRMAMFGRFYCPFGRVGIVPEKALGFECGHNNSDNLGTKNSDQGEEHIVIDGHSTEYAQQDHGNQAGKGQEKSHREELLNGVHSAQPTTTATGAQR